MSELEKTERPKIVSTTRHPSSKIQSSKSVTPIETVLDELKKGKAEKHFKAIDVMQLSSADSLIFLEEIEKLAQNKHFDNILKILSSLQSCGIPLMLKSDVVKHKFLNLIIGLNAVKPSDSTQEIQKITWMNGILLKPWEGFPNMGVCVVAHNDLNFINSFLNLVYDVFENQDTSRLPRYLLTSTVFQKNDDSKSWNNYGKKTIFNQLVKNRNREALFSIVDKGLLKIPFTVGIHGHGFVYDKDKNIRWGSDFINGYHWLSKFEYGSIVENAKHYVCEHLLHLPEIDETEQFSKLTQLKSVLAKNSDNNLREFFNIETTSTERPGKLGYFDRIQSKINELESTLQTIPRTWAMDGIDRKFPKLSFESSTASFSEPDRSPTDKKAIAYSDEERDSNIEKNTPEFSRDPSSDSLNTSSLTRSISSSSLDGDQIKEKFIKLIEITFQASAPTGHTEQFYPILFAAGEKYPRFLMELINEGCIPTRRLPAIQKQICDYIKQVKEFKAYIIANMNNENHPLGKFIALSKSNGHITEGDIMRLQAKTTIESKASHRRSRLVFNFFSILRKHVNFFAQDPICLAALDLLDSIRQITGLDVAQIVQSIRHIDYSQPGCIAYRESPTISRFLRLLSDLWREDQNLELIELLKNPNFYRILAKRKQYSLILESLQLLAETSPEANGIKISAILPYSKLCKNNSTKSVKASLFTELTKNSVAELLLHIINTGFLEESFKTDSEGYYCCWLGSGIDKQPDTSPSKLYIDGYQWLLDHAPKAIQMAKEAITLYINKIDNPLEKLSILEAVVNPKTSLGYFFSLPTSWTEKLAGVNLEEFNKEYKRLQKVSPPKNTTQLPSLKSTQLPFQTTVKQELKPPPQINPIFPKSSSVIFFSRVESSVGVAPLPIELSTISPPPLPELESSRSDSISSEAKGNKTPTKPASFDLGSENTIELQQLPSAQGEEEAPYPASPPS